MIDLFDVVFVSKINYNKSQIYGWNEPIGFSSGGWDKYHYISHLGSILACDMLSL